MQAKVLIVEDDAEIADLIRLYLEKDGMTVIVAPDAETGLESFSSNTPDIVLLDINLPGIDGYEFLRGLRRTRSTPVLIVSAREEDTDIILGLGLGADDFIVKPFAPKVLAARVQAQLRRSRMGPDGIIIRFGPFSLDAEALTLKKDENRIVAPTREIELLAFLARHPEKAFSAEELYEAVWGNAYGDTTTVAVHIQRLRKKIEADPSDPRYLLTVPRHGYRFNAGEGP
jgi:DNA-binding response OmpR family regulator